MTTQVFAYAHNGVPLDAATWATNRLVPAAANRVGAATHNVRVLNTATNALGRGGEVELPNGLYHVNHLGWQISEGPIRIIGQGYDEISPNNDFWYGTCLSVPADQGGTALRVHSAGARGFRMSGIAFRQEMSVPTSGIWRPDAATKGFAVEVENTHGGTIIEDVFFPRAMHGLRVRGTGSGTVGRTTIGRVHGDCIHTLLEMDRVLDACSIAEIHAWPFSAPFPGVWTEAQGALLHAVKLGRVDGAHISRLFTFNASVGVYAASQGSGCPRFVHIDHLYTDLTRVGFLGDGVGAQPGGDMIVSVDSMIHQGGNFHLGDGSPLINGVPLLLRNSVYMTVNAFSAERFPTHLIINDVGTVNLRVGALRTQLAGNGGTVVSLNGDSVVRFAHFPDILSNHLNWRHGGVGTVTLPHVWSV